MSPAGIRTTLGRATGAGAVAAKPPATGAAFRKKGRRVTFIAGSDQNTNFRADCIARLSRVALLIWQNSPRGTANAPASRRELPTPVRRISSDEMSESGLLMLRRGSADISRRHVANLAAGETLLSQLTLAREPEFGAEAVSR